MGRASRPSAPSGRGSPSLYRDNAHKDKLEARNALKQFDFVIDEVQKRKSKGAWKLDLTPSLVRELHRLAIQDIYVCAGEYRSGSVSIGNAPHTPPEHTRVRKLVEEMCRYANKHCADPLHVGAYLLWRVNWIHPFFGGNGRTARAASYLAMSVGLQMIIPGTTTVPDLIVNNRFPYYDALDAADAADANGQMDVSNMQTLLESLLQTQLQTAV